jgi:hypothetical protein
MGNTGVVPSLTTLPPCVIGHDVCKRFGVQIVDEHKVKDLHQLTSVDVKFPAGWTCHPSASDGRHAVFKDEKGVPRFSAFLKSDAHDPFGSISVLSEDEIVETQERDKADKAQQETKSKLEETIAKSWSKEAPFVLYQFTENRHAYEQCLAGHRLYNVAPRSEFAQHKSLGYWSSKDKALDFAAAFCALDDGDFDGYVVQELPDGLDNLDRFERSHLTGEDIPSSYCQQTTLAARTFIARSEMMSRTTATAAVEESASASEKEGERREGVSL